MDLIHYFIQIKGNEKKVRREWGLILQPSGYFKLAYWWAWLLGIVKSGGMEHIQNWASKMMLRPKTWVWKIWIFSNLRLKKWVCNCNYTAPVKNINQSNSNLTLARQSHDLIGTFLDILLEPTYLFISLAESRILEHRLS